jgi:uncharacterized protein Yka (UPF0111/DUF47 family)
MISFQRLLGREKEFCDLLEASARESVHAVAALKHALSDRNAVPMLHEFADARSKDKAITEEISEKLITTFVTPMEREDIESLAESLYKIPKTVEKFAERYRVSVERIRDIDFGKQVSLMEQAVHVVLQMVQALRGGRDLGGSRLCKTSFRRSNLKPTMCCSNSPKSFTSRAFRR